jgi:hypothetical protein
VLHFSGIAGPPFAPIVPRILVAMPGVEAILAIPRSIEYPGVRRDCESEPALSGSGEAQALVGLLCLHGVERLIPLSRALERVNFSNYL